MAFRRESLNKRTLGPVLASAVIGCLLGTIGAYVITQDSTTPVEPSAVEQSILDDPAFGPRE